MLSLSTLKLFTYKLWNDGKYFIVPIAKKKKVKNSEELLFYVCLFPSSSTVLQDGDYLCISAEVPNVLLFTEDIFCV